MHCVVQPLVYEESSYYIVLVRTTRYHFALLRTTRHHSALPRTTMYYYALQSTATYYKYQKVLQSTTMYYKIFPCNKTLPIYYKALLWVLQRCNKVHYKHYNVLQFSSCFEGALDQFYSLQGVSHLEFLHGVLLGYEEMSFILISYWIWYMK